MSAVQQQVKRESGELLRFNLDTHSRHFMRLSQQLHEECNNTVSLSIIVRRALRVYHSFLSRLSAQGMEAEVIETKRAAKGVL